MPMCLPAGIRRGIGKAATEVCKHTRSFIIISEAAVALCEEALCRDVLQAGLWCTYAPLGRDIDTLCCTICNDQEHECQVCRRIIGHDSLSQCPIIRCQRAHSPDGGLTCAAAMSATAPIRVLATTGLGALSLPLLGLQYCTGSCGCLALRLHCAILGLLFLLQGLCLPGILKPLQHLRGTGNPESMSWGGTDSTATDLPV